MTEATRLYTIGFTQKAAETFFSLLAENRVRKIFDTRLNNTGQLAAFAKRDDLAFFAEKLIDAEYVHWIEAAPAEAMLNAYKKKQISWDQYAADYLELIASRRVERQFDAQALHNGCLLCSEAKPHHCHRRLLAEYLREKCELPVKVIHL